MRFTQIRAVAVVTVVIFPGVGSAQNSSHATTRRQPQPLALSLACEKAKISKDESVVLEVKITNRSSEAVSIFGTLLWGHAGGLVLNLSDASGHPVFAEQLDDDRVVPSVLDKPDAYIVLPPDYFFGVTRTDTSKKPVPQQAGMYRLVVEYRSPVPRRYGKSANYWGTEDGVLGTNACEIKYAP